MKSSELIRYITPNEIPSISSMVLDKQMVIEGINSSKIYTDYFPLEKGFKKLALNAKKYLIEIEDYVYRPIEISLYTREGKLFYGISYNGRLLNKLVPTEHSFTLTSTSSFGRLIEKNYICSGCKSMMKLASYDEGDTIIREANNLFVNCDCVKLMYL